MILNDVGDNIYKQLIQLNIKKITQLKNGQNNWIDIYIFSGNADGQQAHKKMLNIANHQGNAN